ncbi:hypothetical protein EK21DRAFT_115265 [Setomelanomma holmii]|uniref:Uncharacterized protein n=1 Tax=Setomelanomma holmii TaxID=210430 RepID=A0A9P4H4U1_9PLEO|nr:hypothetical protein EK21DRAFT_115265 [Setomelanomma holmii]
MAPQAAAHRRGGTHRVKDKDKTNTKFDEWDYKQLKAECIERKIYVKDMKKVEMAMALANDDENQKRKEREAIAERERQQMQLEKEKKLEDNRKMQEAVAKMRRRLERQKRRDADESVSDDTSDEDGLQMTHDEGRGGIDADQFQGGQALSEESWDSTSTETTLRAEERPIVPDCQLRLFEWPFNTMPSPVPPTLPLSPVYSPGGSTWPARIPRVPRSISYTPLKVHTTESKEKIILPGATYPASVEPDYVPILSPRTRNAARQSRLIGVLRKARIEPASAWTTRTQIQGWNAQMYFSLPACNGAKRLLDVYNKWYLGDRQLLRVKPTDSKVDRERRHIQREKNTIRKLAEVLDASEWRPLAVCYLPAYLDYGQKEEVKKEERTLANLRFISFPGCDVPHYYFWVREGNCELAEESDDCEDVVTLKDGTKVAQKRLPGPPKPLRKTLVRVKIPAVPLTPPPSPGNSTTLVEILATVEHHLQTTGLAATLSFYRTKWLANDKQKAWSAFARNLSLLYPSGSIPVVPPTDPKSTMSVAIKIAGIEMIGNDSLLPPLEGDEPWTRDDDAVWNIVEVEVEDANDHSPAKEIMQQDELEALYRRASIQLPSRLSIADCAAWLENVSPGFPPLTPGTIPSSP